MRQYKAFLFKVSILHYKIVLQVAHVDRSTNKIYWVQITLYDLPYFCRNNFTNGINQKIYRPLLGFIFCLCCGFLFSIRCWRWILLYGITFCSYFLCQGIGFDVKFSFIFLGTGMLALANIVASHSCTAYHYAALGFIIKVHK